MAQRLCRVLLLAAFLLVGGLAFAGRRPSDEHLGRPLDIGDDRVEGEVQLPMDRLAIAVDRDLTRAGVLGADRTFLKEYTAAAHQCRR